MSNSRFDALTRAAQTRRYLALARTALRSWDVEPARLTRMAQGFNVSFGVRTADGSRYVLRIHRPDGPTFPMVDSELQWLTALATDTDLAVPQPIPTKDGQLLISASDPGVAEIRTCDLLTWIPGRFRDDSLRPSHLRAVGILMARLQEHAAGWDEPSGFIRRRVDDASAFAARQTNGFTAEVGEALVELVRTEHGDPRADVVGEVFSRTRSAREEIGYAPGDFGLIHADLHQENFLFPGSGRVAAIDFDDCGQGHAVYDLAVTLSELQHRDDYPTLRTALLDGYRTIGNLSTEHESHLDTFVAFRFLQLMIYRIEHRDEAMFRDEWFEEVTGNLGLLTRYMS